jgi:predicted protein tyrosine phosphatase|tara:strand:- start:284 stop:454 length:171 start_codon:yes stop_codon:yes gene_type:complete
MATEPINYKQLMETQKEWVEAKKMMEEKHRQELSALNKHYRKMCHDINFPPKQTNQ